MQLFVNSLKNVFYLLIILAIVIFFHAGNFNFSLHVDNYMYSSWLFNYEYGFMRRGLVGEVIALLNIDYSYTSIRALSFVILLILFYLFTYLLAESLNKLALHEEKYKYIAYFMCLSFLTSQWLIELGRFDQIVQIFQILCVILILKFNKLVLSFFAIAITILLTALIHEASLIIFFPTLILIFYLNHHSKKYTLGLILLVFASILAMALFGKIDLNHANFLIEKYKDVERFNLYSVRTTTLSNMDNIIISYYSMVDHKTYISIVFSILYLYPVIYLIRKILDGARSYLYVLPTLSPLILFIIAFDYFRWISLVFFNIFILCFYLIISTKVNVLNLNKFIVTNKNNIMIYSVISLFVGALGIFNLFPDVRNVGALSERNLPAHILTKLNIAADTHDQLFQVNRQIKGWELELDSSQNKNIEMAAHWYKSESKKGNVFAQNNLAIMYTRGGNINIDYDRAFDLLLLSSQGRNNEAINNLGVMYANGFGVKKNKEKALKYYMDAAQHGSSTAMYNIGISYLNGLNGLTPNKTQARKWFERAAKLNFDPAIYKLKFAKW